MNIINTRTKRFLTSTMNLLPVQVFIQKLNLSPNGILQQLKSQKFSGGACLQTLLVGTAASSRGLWPTHSSCHFVSPLLFYISSYPTAFEAWLWATSNGSLPYSIYGTQVMMNFTNPWKYYFNHGKIHREVAIELLNDIKSSDWPSLMWYTTKSSDT